MPVPTTAFAAGRRQFLRSGASVGLAAVAPLLLSDCGGSDDAPTNGSTEARAEREARLLQFDLSSATVQSPTLFALRSNHHGKALKAHTAQTRAAHRAADPALASVADQHLTHYLEDVDLPATALQAVLVFGVHAATGEPVLCGAHVHVPRRALEQVAARATARRQAPLAGAKARAYGLRVSGLSSAELVSGNSFQTPLDIATFLVFHDHEVMNLKPDLGAEILQRIEQLPCAVGDDSCNTFLDSLAFAIGTAIENDGYPTTSPGSWAMLVAMTRLDGSAVLDENGKPVYRYELDDGIAKATRPVIVALRKNILDDPLFEGINWHKVDGMASADAAAAPSTGLQAGTFDVAATFPAGSTRHGVKCLGVAVTDAASRAVRLTVSNYYLRFLSVYVEFKDATGKLIDVADPNDDDSSRSKFLAAVFPADQIMGIPLMGGAQSSSDIEFQMPPAAAAARVIFGSLGVGGDAFTKEAVIGSSLTLALCLGLPTMFLALGIYADAKEVAEGQLKALLEDKGFLRTVFINILQGARVSGDSLAEGIYSGDSGHSPQDWIAGLANVVLKALLNAAPTLAAKVLATVTSQLLAQSTCVVGIALKILATVADVATIVETLVEVLANPAISDNTITLKMTSNVVVSRDPTDFQFPASARTMHVAAYYDGGAMPRTVDVPIAQGQVDPVTAVFNGVASGGKVTYLVNLLSASGCLVGSAKSTQIVNLPETAGTVALTIKEIVAALAHDTVYRHSLKLTYQGDHRAWANLPAPVATQLNLCQGTETALCELNSLTVHTASGMVGYSFKASGAQITECGTHMTAVLHLAQNLFLGTDPDSAFKYSGCGFADPLGIAYDPLGEIDGKHFFVRPNDDKGFLVQSIVLDATTPIDMSRTLTWGRFNTPLDSLAVVSSGYVVGVNRSTHQMEILTLPAVPQDIIDAPRAVSFATIKLGKGKEPGRLDTPVAVAARDGVIYVLEQGNRRVQAFDHSGNLAKIFQSKASNVVNLPTDATAFVDLAVEQSAGYIFVLSTLNDGSQATDYRLDIYSPMGDAVARNTGIAVARIAVDLFRNLYTLNFEALQGTPHVEPALSQWLPDTPSACVAAPSARIAQTRPRNGLACLPWPPEAA